jgi:hypothetical protein
MGVKEKRKGGDFENISGIDYDPNFIDLNTYVKNLKTNTVELTEKIYVDKPIRK